VAEFFRALWHLRAPFAFLFVLYLLLAVAICYVSGPVDSGSGTPSSFWETLYFCAMRAIAFGYRNIVPTTTVGHIDSASLGVLSILMFSVLQHLVRTAARGVD
jgi:voltage-gated potassium channel